MKNRTIVVAYLSIVFLCSCECWGEYTYSVENRLNRSIQVQYIDDSYRATEDIDTLVDPQKKIVLFLRSGGVVCGGNRCNCNIQEDTPWRMDSLIITIDDTLRYTRFGNRDYWVFRSENTDGYYDLIIDEGKIN